MYISKMFGNFDMFPSNHVSFMFDSTQMYLQTIAHIVLTNHSTTLADYSSVSFMRHDVQKYSSDVLYNIYKIYISVKSLSHL
jgi:hypothetical protein